MAEQYIVSARKYRPQTFDTVVGQQHITTTLKNAIRHQHLAHAYLFCGPRGVGKTTCARILARTINCENPTPDIEACGTCPTCVSFNNNTSFNIFELDAASNNSVDDIRELVNQVRFAPQQGKYKIYIIDEVHMLSAAAFNAFLKTLEEPPPYAIFILATTEKHKILPTILSRCQIFDFKRITTEDTVAHLHSIATKEGIVAQEAALHVIAQKSEGCMRDSLSMLDRITSFTNGMLTYQSTMEHLNLLDADYYFKLTDHMLAQDVSGTLLLLDQVLDKGFEGDVILEGLAGHMRNLLLCKDARMAKLLDVPKDHQAVYYEKANQTPPSFILSALHVINESELSYKNANNKRLHVEMCLIRLCYVLQATGAEAVNTGMEKKTDNVAAPTALMPGTNPEPDMVPQPQRDIPPQQPQTIPTPQPQPVPSPERDVPTHPAEPEHPKELPQRGSVSNIMPGTNKPEMPPQQPQTIPQPEPQPVPGPERDVPTHPAQPEQPGTVPPAQPDTQPQRGPGGTRRISRDLLNSIQSAVTNAPKQQSYSEAHLTAELAQEAYEQYIQGVKANNKSMLYAQMSQMKVEVYPPDEVRLIGPSDLSGEYALEQRDVLINHFRKHTGVLVRVRVEVRVDEDVEQSQQTTVLSKTEILEAMIQKNPDLGALKDQLSLQIEY